MPMPESMEMYPGTSGKTHGDKIEISPARNAPARETSVIPDSSSSQLSERNDLPNRLPRDSRLRFSTPCENGPQVYKRHWPVSNRP
jgi:hypothetical protein